MSLKIVSTIDKIRVIKLRSFGHIMRKDDGGESVYVNEFRWEERKTEANIDKRNK